MICFTHHALIKIKLIKEHGVEISKDLIREAIQNPDFTTQEKFGRKAAYKILGERLALRVIYEKNKEIMVITVMIVRRKRYEKDHV